MVVANGVQRVPAHANAAGHEDQADDEGGQRFDPAVAVGVVLVGRLAGDDEADQHHRRRQHVPGELHAGGEHRRRLDVEPDADVQRGQHRAGDDAGERDRAADADVPVDRGLHAHILPAVEARISTLMLRMYAAVEMPISCRVGIRRSVGLVADIRLREVAGRRRLRAVGLDRDGCCSRAAPSQ